MSQRRGKRVHEAERVRPCPLCHCPHASLHNSPVCSIGISQKCVKRGYTSRWHHLSPSEHYCNDCFDYVYRSHNQGHPYLEEWQERWGSDSYLEPTVKLFFAEHVLPFWLQCHKCMKWRRVQSTCVPVAGDSASLNVAPSHLLTESGSWKPFTCSQMPASRKNQITCQTPEEACVSEASGVFWLTDLGYMPLLLSSPAVAKVKAYFPDGVGHSPSGPYLTGIKVETGKEAEAAESPLPLVPVHAKTSPEIPLPSGIHAAVVTVNKEVAHAAAAPQSCSRHWSSSSQTSVHSHTNRQKRGGPGTIGHCASTSTGSKAFEEGYGPSDYFQPFFHPDEEPKARSFRPDTMEPSECQYFPEFSTLKHPTLYLGLRNLALALWQDNCKEPLTVEKCMEHVLIRGLIRVRCQLELGRILAFLTRFAFVNTGIIGRPLPSLPHIATVVRGRPGVKADPQKESLKAASITAPKVVVVGAGPSGLAAAHHLHNLGVKVTVVEARDRIGGRVYDDRSLGVCVGHGAQVVNGCVNNPVSLLCKQIGISMHRIGERCDLLTENGHIAHAVEDRCIESLFNALLDDVGAWRQSVLDERNTVQLVAEQEMLTSNRGVSASNRGPSSCREGPSPSGRGRARKVVRQKPSDILNTNPPQHTCTPVTVSESNCRKDQEAMSRSPAAVSVVKSESADSEVVGNDKKTCDSEAVVISAEQSIGHERKHSLAVVKSEIDPNSKDLLTCKETCGSNALSLTGEVCCGRASTASTNQALTTMVVGIECSEIHPSARQACGNGSTEAQSSPNSAVDSDSSKPQPSPSPAADSGSSETHPSPGPAAGSGHCKAQSECNAHVSNLTASSNENSMLTEFSSPEDLSLAAMLSDAQERLLSKKGVLLSREEEQLLHFHLGNLEYSCGATLDKVSAMNWDQNERFALFAGDHTIMTEGFSSILSKLAEPLDLQLNTLVKSIDYRQESITMETSCNAKHQDLIADYVLVTAPLSLLKRGSIEFRPSLPSWKQGAIDRLGAGIIEKVALRFPHRFWDKKIQRADFFAHVPMCGELRGLCGIFYDMSLEATDGCAVLMTIVSGEALKLKAKLSDEELVEHVMEILQKLFPDEDVPMPEKWLVSHWSEDPLAGMSYSYVATGSSGEDYDLLAQDLDKRVFFAGEATNRQHPQTVTGAYLSGIREAAKIVEIIGNQSHSTQ